MNFEVPRTNEKLCTDVSYFWTKEDWLYLSAVMDLFGRKIITHVISKHNDLKLATDTLDKTAVGRNLSGRLFHSDQGCLYTSLIFREKGFRI